MKSFSKIIRWIARALGLGAVLLLVRLAMKEELPDPLVLGVDERHLFGALALMPLGVLAAWKWEVAGGLVTFCGYGLLWYLEGYAPEPVFSIFPLAACLSLIAWMLEHKPVLAAEQAPKKTRQRGKGQDKKKSAKS